MLAVGFALILGFAAQAQAQEEGAKVEIGEGRVMHRSGNTLIVDVKKGTHLGIQRFNLSEVKHLKFYKYGNEIQPQDLKKDDMVTAYADNAAVVPVTITYDEVVELQEAQPAPEPAPAPAPAPAARPAPAPAPAPAALPSTGSHLPLILVLAVAFLAVGLTLTVLRRF
jgi:hypothetical protein